jgi:hypothetical protein
MNAQEFYDQFDTYNITENPDPDYNLPFYQNIFRLMESYHQAKSEALMIKWSSEIEKALLRLPDYKQSKD